MLKNVRGVVGLREFLAAIKREISTPVPVVSEAKEQTNITNLSSLKEGDKFKILEDGALQIRAFMYKLPYELNKDLVFIVQKATPHTVFAIGAGNEKYQDEKGRVPFKITNTGHWRSEGKDIKVKKLS